MTFVVNLNVRVEESYISHFTFSMKLHKAMKFSVHALAFAALATSADAFSTLGSFAPSSNLSGMKSSYSLKMSLEKYSDELKETAAKMIRPGFGLLACDESTGTVGTRLESIGLENIEENRKKVSGTSFD